VESSPQPARVRRLRQVTSIISVCLIAVTALAVPYALRTVHAAASPAHVASNTCAQLPVGKDPTTFTAAQLKTYGLPPRMTGQNHAVWERFASHARHRICTPDPSLHLPRASATALCGSCWSGLGAHDENTIVGQCGCSHPFTDTGFTSVTTDFIVPCPDPTTLENGSGVSGWVGLGNVVQTGVAIDTVTDSFQVYPGITVETIVPRFTAWVENTYYAPNRSMIPVFSVNCGDEIIAGVYEAANGVRDAMLIADLMSGLWYVTAFGPNPDPKDIECIVEDYLVGNQRPDLMDFGQWNFNSCTASDVFGQSGSVYQFWDSSTTAGARQLQWDMTDNRGNTMTFSQGIDINPGSFFAYWEAPN
jgi:hypothetical protein